MPKNAPSVADSIFDALERKQPRTIKVPVVLDDEWADRWEQARAALDIAKMRADDSPTDAARRSALAKAEEQVDELRAEMDAHVVEFVFQGIGPIAYDELVNANLATPAQVAEAKKAGRPVPVTNSETFPIAVVAASLVSPELPFDRVAALFSDARWNGGELGALADAAVFVNQRRRDIRLD